MKRTFNVHVKKTVTGFHQGFEDINNFLKNVGKSQKRSHSKHESLRSYLWNATVTEDEKKIIAELKYPIEWSDSDCSEFKDLKVIFLLTRIRI